MKITKRVIIISILVVLLVASVGLAAAVMIPSADELLTQSLETLETITSGHAVVDVTADMQNRSLGGTFEIWAQLNAGVDGGPAFRIEVLEASEAEAAGVTAVADGSQFWLYVPSNKTVIVGNVGEMAPLLAEKLEGYWGEGNEEGTHGLENMEKPENSAEAAAKLLEYFTAERAGQEPFGDHEALRLRLVPIAEKIPDEFIAVGGFLNLWLRTSDQLPLAIEYAESPLGYARIEATSVEINTLLDESLFTFDMPEGAVVVPAAELLSGFNKLGQLAEPVDFEILTPANLPLGAVAAEPEHFGGAVVQRFNMPGDQSFVIAQGAAFPLDPPEEALAPEKITVRGAEASLFANSEASRTLLTWSEGDIFFLIGGDLTPEQAVAIAESLQ